MKLREIIRTQNSMKCNTFCDCDVYKYKDNRIRTMKWRQNLNRIHQLILKFISMVDSLIHSHNIICLWFDTDNSYLYFCTNKVPSFKKEDYPYSIFQFMITELRLCNIIIHLSLYIST